MEPTCGVCHQAEAVPPAVSIFPSDDSLTGAGGGRRPEDEKQGSRGGRIAFDCQARLTIEANHRLDMLTYLCGDLQRGIARVWY